MAHSPVVDHPVFAILIQQQPGRVICTLQAVRYPGGAFATAPHQPPELLATASIESSTAGMTATCSRRAGDGWDIFTVTDRDPGPALWFLLDLTAQSQARTSVNGAPVYIVYYPAFATVGAATLTRKIGLSVTYDRCRVTNIGHVHETYLGFDGRRVEVYRYRRGNPNRATRIRFIDPGTDSLLLADHALDRLTAAHHRRPGLLGRWFWRAHRA